MRNEVMIIALGVALAVHVTARTSDAAPVLCQKKSGSVVVRDPACKRKETSLDLTQFGAIGPKGPAGNDGTNGTSAIVQTTTLSWGGSQTDPNSDLTWRQHRVIGDFTKTSATSRVLVTVNGSMSTDVYSCMVQVRIDGKDAAGATATAISSTGNPGATGQRGTGAALQAPYGGSIVSPFSITADFGALASGMHTVTLWTASNGASNNCSTDPYNYHAGTVVVLETGS